MGTDEISGPLLAHGATESWCLNWITLLQRSLAVKEMVHTGEQQCGLKAEGRFSRNVKKY